MTDRDSLIRTYLMRQKDLADQEQRHKNLKIQVEEKRKHFQRTENYIKNLETIG